MNTSLSFHRIPDSINGIIEDTHFELKKLSDQLTQDRILDAMSKIFDQYFQPGNIINNEEYIGKYEFSPESGMIVQYRHVTMFERNNPDGKRAEYVHYYDDQGNSMTFETGLEGTTPTNSINERLGTRTQFTYYGKSYSITQYYDGSLLVQPSDSDPQEIIHRFTCLLKTFSGGSCA